MIAWAAASWTPCATGSSANALSMRWRPVWHAHSRRGCALLARSGSDDKPDLIERLVGSLFKGALEDKEPFGLKRMSEEDFPEIYPATTTEFAAPVDSDTPDMAAFRPLLAKTQLERKQLRLAYDANRDGWSSEAFHAAVDTFGAAVVVATTAGGSICGGYNPRGFIGIGEDRDAIAAFLFTWPDGDVSKPAIKLPKVGGPSLAVVDRGGIQFGAEGLTIPLAEPEARKAKCRLGTYYARLPDGGRSLFAADESLKGTLLVDLKVYVTEGPPEEFELDGLVWKTKQG